MTWIKEIGAGQACTGKEIGERGLGPLEEGNEVTHKSNGSEVSRLVLVGGLRAEHARMLDDLDRLSLALIRAPREDFPHARAALEDWISGVLVPHADNEQDTYDMVAALGAQQALQESLETEHRIMRHAAEGFSEVWDSRAAGPWSRSLYTAFDAHRRKEEELLFPRLLAA